MRPIDADVLHETISYAFSDGHDDSNGRMLGSIIDEAPTINYDELVHHGRWELVDKDPWDFCPGTGWRCSECGNTIYLVHNTPDGYNYCSHCGSKMDGFIDPHAPTKYDMERILLYTKKPVKPEDIFVFEIQLASNEVDKDGEYFSPECLWSMQWLFLGKRGISQLIKDDKMAPRIFDTRIEENEFVKTKSGEPVIILFAKAFIIRTDDNKQLISEIEKGNCFEISVSISFRKNVCNICGQSGCQHVIGKTYNGKTCYRALCEPVDAYEWAFVKRPKTKIKIKKEFR